MVVENRRFVRGYTFVMWLAAVLSAACGVYWMVNADDMTAAENVDMAFKGAVMLMAASFLVVFKPEKL